MNRPEYMRRLDGMMFGENPREGFFENASFRHPDMAFRMEFPQGWKTSNQKQSVGAMSPNEDAIVTLELAPAPTAQQAAQKFFSQQGVESGETSRRDIGGFPAVMSTFRAQTEGGYLRGLVAWIDYRDRVFQILGYTPEARWNQYSNVFGAAITSFGRETDSAVLNVQPSRLRNRESEPDVDARNVAPRLPVHRQPADRGPSSTTSRARRRSRPATSSRPGVAGRG